MPQFGETASHRNSLSRAETLEHAMSEALDKLVVKSVIYTSGEIDPTQFPNLSPSDLAGKRLLMGDDPRLVPMPEKPTLLDFFKYRFAPATHLLQSAQLALKAGHNEKVVLACLLHDIAFIGFIRSEHGYWGAQLLEPYVDEEIAWAIRAHQVLRFFPDESVGYAYPEAYVQFFGEDFRPEPYVEAAYRKMRDHKYYMTARLITLNDVYSFDPAAVVDMEAFTDIIGRNFKQPEEGLGFDDSPSAHMWRTIIWPTKFL
ncbi:MAG: HD domain-containing protein [Beijerinckiaceae bacterium]|nr:MAG: HD domain-containing protein [Beijerinckiaceae bacterium]